MDTQYPNFFGKYPMKHTEKHVLKAIHKAVEDAEKCYKQNPEDHIYIKYLVQAKCMLEDYFSEKGIDPDHYK
jgi:hypothetical protein